jgi:peptidoglycan/xylan/chitin deacetylase (PgdA/CDA1 family)
VGRGAWRADRCGRIAVSLLPAFLLVAFAPVPAAGEAEKMSSAFERPGIAITFDDLPFNRPETSAAEVRAINSRIVNILTSRGIPAVGFVNEGKLYRAGENDARVNVLRLWVEAGLELGNHTFSHLSLQETSLEEFKEDVIRGEKVTRALLAERGKAPRWFRHPYLHVGPSPEVREAFEAWLRERGYTVAPVTVENSDWIFNRAYLAARARGGRELQRRVGRAYLEFTEAELEFHEKAARELLGRPIRQVLLLHVNALTAEHLEALVEILSKRGYAFLTLEEALEDSAYGLPDRYAGPAGVSWLFRWDHTRGRRIDWRQEPVPPAFVLDLSREIAPAGGN